MLKLQIKFLKTTLLLLVTNLLISCSANIYTSDGCLLFPKIPVSESDKEALKKNNDLSYQFILAVANHNEIHDTVCTRKKVLELWK